MSGVTFQKRMRAALENSCLELIPEAFTTLGLLAIVGTGRWLFKYWIGEDARFFDYLKVSYVFDAGDLTVLARFLWTSLRKFR